jgi:hypothetical protein
MSDMGYRTLRNIRKQIKTDEPDVGSRGVELGQDEVERKVTRARLMEAIRLGEKSSKPEHKRTHIVSGADKDEKSLRSAAFGDKSAETSNRYTKATPNSSVQSESFSSVKVAAVQKNERRKVKAIKADRTTVADYAHIINSSPLMLDVPIDEMPMLAYPSNDSEQVAEELDIIIDTQDAAPLTDAVMGLADEEPIELFRRACHAVGVPVDEETAEMLVQDLRRIAITLKYTHLRPRPSEVAPYHNRYIVLQDFDPYDDTPSYPSVHATIGYGLANMYANLYPEFAQEFNNVGDTIALQRIQSGRHYPSDNEYARVIANLVLK